MKHSSTILILLALGALPACLGAPPAEVSGGSILGDDELAADPVAAPDQTPPAPAPECTAPVELGSVRGDPYCPEFVDWGDARCSMPVEERWSDLSFVGTAEQWLSFDLTEARWGAIEDLTAYVVVSTLADDGVDRYRVEARLEGECGATVTPCDPPFALTLVRQMTRTAVRIRRVDIPAHDDALRVLVHVVPIDSVEGTSAPWLLDVSSLRLPPVPLDPDPNACEGQ